MIKLLNQRSTFLPNLKLKNLIKNEEDQKTARLYNNSRMKLIKHKSSDLKDQIFLSQEKNEMSDIIINKENNKKCSSFKPVDKGIENINELSQQIDELKSQLNEEKLKSEVLREIAEEEKKKHILYKQKFKNAIFGNSHLADDIKTNNNNTKKTISYVSDKKKSIDVQNYCNNLYSIKNANFCNSMKDNNIKSNMNNSNINSFSLSPNKDLSTLVKTIQVSTKSEFIKNALLTKKIKIKNLKKYDNELNELKEENITKDKIIEKLKRKIEELKEENNKLNNDKKAIEEENSKLEEEIQFKNNEIEIIKSKLNEELDINQKYVNKFKEIKDINEKIINELQIEKEHNRKLRKKLNNKIEENKKIEKIKKDDKKEENPSDKKSKRSLEKNKMKDISYISCIEISQQDQLEQEDSTLKEIFQKKLFEV